MMPRTAVVYNATGSAVYVAEAPAAKPRTSDEAALKKVKLRAVMLGPVNGSDIIVHQGVQTGEIVAVSGQNKLYEGALITPRATAPAPAR